MVDATAVDARLPTLVLDARRVSIGRREATCRARLLLRWRDDAAAPRWAVPGLWLSVEGEYRPPEDARNPGLDPPGRWMERDGLAGSVDVDPRTVAAPVDPPERAFDLAALTRDRLARLFSVTLAPPVAALARGILLGDRSGIEPATRDAFRDGGTIHILSVSGLHVCILGGIAAFAAASVRLSAGVGLAAELLAVWAYTLLVGAPASALRASILWSAVRSGRAIGREVRPLAAWALAGLVLHLADPRAPHDPGFQLSFAAVLGLLAMGGVAPRGSWARGALGIAAQSAGATAGTMGIVGRLFGAVPVAGLLLNVAVVPLCGLFMAETLLFMGAAALAPSPLRDAAAGAVDVSGFLLLAVNAWGAHLAAPWPIRWVPPGLAVAAGLAALLLAAGLREGARGAAPSQARRGRVTALLLTAAAATFPLVPWAAPGSSGAPGAFLLAVDVGQGDALLAGWPAGSLLVDAGPSDGARDAGRSAVEPALRAEEIGRVRAGILTHAHRDHYGGLGWLAARGWLSTLLDNGSDPRGIWRRPIDAGLRRHGARAVSIARDTVVSLGRDAHLRIWAPPPDPLPATTGNAAENDRSLVAALALGGVRIFLPGDAEVGLERAMLGRLSPTDVLKSPHHGSRTSSAPEWLARLKPRVILVSCGEQNRFGHPDRATLGRYRLIGAAVFRTDREGAIRLTPAARGAWISTRAHPAPVFIPLPAARPPGDLLPRR